MALDESTRNATILVVDDEHEFRRLLVKILELEGFHVMQAAHAQEAWEILSQTEEKKSPSDLGIDLMLLDVALPGMNGMTLFSKMQQDERLRRIPVMFLTGDSKFESKERAFEAGAVDYITKPFQKKDLMMRIRAHVRERWDREAEKQKAEGKTSQVTSSLKEAEQRFLAVVRNSFHLVCELDPDLKVTYGSPNHSEILAINIDTLLGKYWPDLVLESERQELVQNLKEILETGAEKRMLIQVQDGSGYWRWLDLCASRFKTSLGIPHLLLVSRDITHAKETERYLQHLALHDPLTGLANRQQFMNELESVCARYPEGAPYGVIYADVDNFKLINDRHGHFIGDQVLRDVGDFLTRALGDDAVVISRFGGDEFCILVRAADYQSAQALGERTCELIARNPILSSGERHRITLSIGIALMEADVSVKEVLSRANMALHVAKSSGRNRCCVYRSDSNELLRVRRSAEWFQRIQEGLDEARFKVWYQPILDLCTGQVSCYEALIRFTDQDGHVHSPAAFLPSAERYSLMTQIDRYMVNRIFSDLIAYPDMRVSINLSGSSITDSTLGAFLEQCFSISAVDPSRVVFEITETVFMMNLAQARTLVERLQAFGCQFALDDFGSGFSSLNYLRNLPVNIVKIDGSFVREIDKDPVSLALLKSINEIAHLLGKKTVAEWIETEETFNILKGIGVDYGQGYYAGKPQPLEDLNLKTRPTWSKVGEQGVAASS